VVKNTTRYSIIGNVLVSTSIIGGAIYDVGGQGEVFYSLNLSSIRDWVDGLITRFFKENL
jgi:hypothetical protein